MVRELLGIRDLVQMQIRTGWVWGALDVVFSCCFWGAGAAGLETPLSALLGAKWKDIAECPA